MAEGGFKLVLNRFRSFQLVLHYFEVQLVKVLHNCSHVYLSMFYKNGLKVVCCARKYGGVTSPFYLLPLFIYISLVLICL